MSVFGSKGVTEVPIYEYECEACRGRFEVMQKFSDKPLRKCTRCGGGPIMKVLSPPALLFKGSGWYVTDYARPEREKAKRRAEGDSKGNGKGNGNGSSSSGSSASATPSSTSSTTPSSD